MRNSSRYWHVRKAKLVSLSRETKKDEIDPIDNVGDEQ